ncbi:hypothetical protein BC941DRAFT_441670 [Chlamydoabsidia padenii]|nr:hypothetical protein BC941DRAFT_441670 [Chlamydoabsidia padenii]
MPSDNPKYCDYVGDLLFNVDNSCYTDCVMELINRVILPYVVQETEDGGDNSLNILLQTLRQYALEGKFAQALGVARNFIWQSDRFPRGTMQDCRDVLHFLSDNSIKNSLCSTKKCSNICALIPLLLIWAHTSHYLVQKPLPTPRSPLKFWCKNLFKHRRPRVLSLTIYRNFYFYPIQSIQKTRSIILLPSFMATFCILCMVGFVHHR